MKETIMTRRKPCEKRGKPKKIDASPERVARAMFSAVKKPDPSLKRKPRLG